MRRHDFFSPSLFGVLILITFSGTAVADLSTQQLVDDFNTMNNPNGYLFRTYITNDFYNSQIGSGEMRLRNYADPLTGRTPDLSAYQIGNTASNGSGADFNFQTFCVTPEVLMGFTTLLNGKLNYESDQTRTSNSKALTLGVAWLYKEFAAGTLTGYNYNYGANRVASALLLQDAIWFLMGVNPTYMDNAGTDWTNNIFLQSLVNMPGYDWTATYDPASNYGGLMGDSKVFVLNVRDADNSSVVRQDALYVVRYGDSSVPEPASLLLWALGSMGAFGVAYHQRRKNSK